MSAVNAHEALIFAMVTMSAVDRKMTDAELQRIANVVRQMPVFAGFDVDRLVDVAEDCGERLGDETGLSEILDIIAETVPPRLYEMAYACAVEVAAADLKVTDEEVRLLELLRDRLGLDKLTTAAIERSARARHQTL
jgi:tellurite resistance protein